MKYLKSLLSIASGVLLLSSLSNGEARSLAEIKATKTLIVGITANVPPFQFKVGQNYTGFEINMVSAVAKSLGVEVVYNEIPSFVDLFAALQKDQVDMVASTLEVTTSRDAMFDQTIPYACLAATIMTLDPKIKANTDLKGKRVGVINGTVFKTYVEKLPIDMKVVSFPTREDLRKDFTDGKVDASVGWKAMMPFLAKIYYPTLNLDTQTLWSIPVAFGVQNKNTGLRLAINSALYKMQRDGTFDTLDKKYFPSESVKCAKT